MMNKEQFQFVQDVMLLIMFIHSKGWRVTFGEAWRPREMQAIYLEEGKTQTMDSYHMKRLAIDLNFFMPRGDGEYKLTYKKEHIKVFGDFWENLSPQNRWGGNFESMTDTPHFERTM